MVTPAMQLASKIPDVHVQLWASALLKGELTICSNLNRCTKIFFPTDLYRMCGNPQGEAEGYRLHDSFSQSLLKDMLQSTQQSEHKLIHVRCFSFVFSSLLTSYFVLITVDRRSVSISSCGIEHCERTVIALTM
jgi:hypothetical protein